MSNRLAGDIGEREVIALVRCPNCQKKLMLLPPGYPLYDVQCTGCSFRAQVKTNRSKPKSEIFGAGWQIMDKVLKSGFVTPPLIAHFKWGNENNKSREIRFYPFVPKSNLKKYQLPPTAKRANYWMFNYTGLDTLPHFVLHKEWLDQCLILINDLIVNYQEFVTAKTKLEQLRHHVKNMKDTSNYFERELSEYLEAVITVKGHALCMDVKSERQKMAKLIAGVLSNL